MLGLFSGEVVKCIRVVNNSDCDGEVKALESSFFPDAK